MVALITIFPLQLFSFIFPIFMNDFYVHVYVLRSSISGIEMYYRDLVSLFTLLILFVYSSRFKRVSFGCVVFDLCLVSFLCVII